MARSKRNNKEWGKWCRTSSQTANNCDCARSVYRKSRGVAKSSRQHQTSWGRARWHRETCSLPVTLFKQTWIMFSTSSQSMKSNGASFSIPKAKCTTKRPNKIETISSAKNEWRKSLNSRSGITSSCRKNKLLQIRTKSIKSEWWPEYGQSTPLWCSSWNDYSRIYRTGKATCRPKPSENNWLSSLLRKLA